MPTLLLSVSLMVNTINCAGLCSIEWQEPTDYEKEQLARKIDISSYLQIKKGDDREKVKRILGYPNYEISVDKSPTSHASWSHPHSVIEILITIRNDKVESKSIWFLRLSRDLYFGLRELRPAFSRVIR